MKSKNNLFHLYLYSYVSSIKSVTFIPFSISLNQVSGWSVICIISGECTGFGNKHVACFLASQYTKIASLASPSLGSIQYSPKMEKYF